MKTFQGQGKVREFHFQSGKFRKNEKKSGNFKIFKKKLPVNRLLKTSFSNIYGFRFFLNQNCNPTPLDIYIGLSQVYSIKSEGRIH